jgi:hypothetical protein
VITTNTMVTLSMTAYDVEQNHDYLTVNGFDYTTTTSPEGVIVDVGQDVLWRSDGSVVANGWEMCATDAPPAPPPPPTPSPPPASGASSNYWEITSGSSYCQMSRNGKCVTDGSGSYGNDEMCTFVARSAFLIAMSQYDVEDRHDYLQVDGTAYYGGSYTRGPSDDGVSRGGGFNFPYYAIGPAVFAVLIPLSIWNAKRRQQSNLGTLIRSISRRRVNQQVPHAMGMSPGCAGCAASMQPMAQQPVMAQPIAQPLMAVPVQQAQPMQTMTTTTTYSMQPVGMQPGMQTVVPVAGNAGGNVPMATVVQAVPMQAGGYGQPPTQFV